MKKLRVIVDVKELFFQNLFFGGEEPLPGGEGLSVPAALLPVDASHVATVPSTPAAISAKPPCKNAGRGFINHKYGA
jgi:hypothetical protein